MKPEGYWTLESTLAECRKVVDKYGELPAQKKLREMKMSGLVNRIEKNGGYSKIREKLGLEIKQRPHGYWNLENTLDECKKVVEKYGELPSGIRLGEMKMSSLAAAILRNGGYGKIREMLGVKEGYKPKGYWTLKNTLAECRKVVREYGELPSYDKLHEMKMAGLSMAITENGGMKKIAEILGLKVKKQPNKYWTLENTLAECKKVIEKYGELFSSRKLEKMKMSGLSGAIIKNGGFPKIREMIGIKEQNPLKEAIMEYLEDEK